MEIYCVSCKKYTENENSNVRKTKQNRIMLLSNCGACGKKKSTFIKNKELHNFAYFKMNKIVNKFLLTDDIFMAELHLKQPRLLLILLVSHLLNIMKEFKNLKEQLS